MAKRAVLDLALGAIILLLAAFLVQSIADRPGSRVTELYFTDHSRIPSLVDKDIPVSFTIRNSESIKMAYRAEIIAELYQADRNTENLSLDSVLLTLDSGNTAAFSETYRIDKDFSRMKLRIVLRGQEKDEELSYWARSRAYIMDYETLGNGTVECLSSVNYVQYLQKISISAIGTEGDGYPIMQVWLDGKKIAEHTVSGAMRFDIPTDASFGMHYLDIAFINDYYDKVSGDDRNLYIEQVFSQGRPLKPSFIDSGKGLRAFDCMDEAKGLQSEGAVRYKIMVGGPQ